MTCQFLQAQPQVCPPSQYPIINGGPIKLPPTLPPTVVPPPTTPPPEEDRIVFWVHGLGGEPVGWEPVSNFYGNERKMISMRPDYTEASLEGAAIELFQYMDLWGDEECEEHDIEPAQNFVIGHSQGGMASRSLDMLHVQGNNNVEGSDGYRIGGIVTYGSPNQGAQILNNVNPLGANMAVNLAVDGCEALLAGPKEVLEDELQVNLHDEVPFFVKFVSFVASPFAAAIGHPLYELVIPENIQIPLPNGVVEFACEATLPKAIPIFFEPYLAGATQDYAVGSPFLNSLNSYSSSLRKVAIYAEEDEDPVVWHTMSSFFADNPTNADVFEADDETLPAKAEELANTYLLKAMAYEEEGNDDASYGYMKGYNWLNSVDLSWKVIIGAATVFEGETCTCYVYNSNGTFQYTFPANGGPTGCLDVPNLPPFTSCMTNGTFYYVIETPSDGIVTVESASNLPGATGNPIKMEHSNHLEMRNNPQTKDALDFLFGGGSDPWFITENH